MKTNLKLTFSTLLLLMVVPIVSMAQINLGLGIKAGTTGLGADAILRFHPKMDVRAGFDNAGYTYGFSFDQNDIVYDAEAKLKVGTVSALFDFHPTNWFFISAGAAYNLFKIEVAGTAQEDIPYGDISIPRESVGDFLFTAGPGNKISPYVGIGLGNTLGVEKRIAFAFELGTYFQGSPDLTIVADGLLSPTSDPAHGQEELFEKQISQYTIYPVIKFSLSYRIF